MREDLYTAMHMAQVDYWGRCSIQSVFRDLVTGPTDRMWEDLEIAIDLSIADERDRGMFYVAVRDLVDVHTMS